MFFDAPMIAWVVDGRAQNTPNGGLAAGHERRE
jgi:hypothetical protein